MVKVIKELWLFRRYILNNALGEIKFRYSGSMLGVFWNVLNPLFQILVYTIVFSSIMLAKLPGLNSTGAFAIYLCAGLLGWISFSETLTRGTNSFIENSTFLKKLPIPEHIFIAQVCLSSCLNVFISYSILAIISLITGYGLSVLWLLVPIILILLLLFGFGLALTFSSINVFFRDISQLMGILTSIWMWLTPIVYVKDILPDEFKSWMYYNPIYPYITSLHQLIVFHNWPSLDQWVKMFLTSAASIVLGYFVLSKLRREIRDNI